MLRAGKFNRKVTVQRRSAGQDAAGQPVETWEPVASDIWANVLTQNGLETIKADRPVSQVKASIRIRWRTGIDAGMRVLLGAAVYEIQAVLPDEAGREYVDLACELIQ